MLNYWLWPLVTRLLGAENAQRVAALLVGLARLVEGGPNESDGLGEVKKKAVMESIIGWLDAKGLWSHYSLHVWFWTGILSRLIDYVVEQLKAHEWGEVPGVDEALVDGELAV